MVKSVSDNPEELTVRRPKRYYNISDTVIEEKEDRLDYEPLLDVSANTKGFSGLSIGEGYRNGR